MLTPGLTSIIADEAPSAIKHSDIKSLFGRKVAIDASMSLYQFLIAVRQSDGQQMMTESGEITSHLLGFFYRTIRMVDCGIKPAYVFDGKPPDLKKDVLEKRFGRREEAREKEEETKDIADAQLMDQLARRQVRPTREHNAEVQRLLTLMGIPWLAAPCEAEAQCAELARKGRVYAAGSEDMDTLTFGTPVLLKNLTASEQKKLPVTEVSLEAALHGLDMPMEQFTDLCLLLGCDYLDPVRGIGPKTALKLIREHGRLENVLAHITRDTDDTDAPRKRGIQVPEIWPFEAARELFLHPLVTDGAAVELRWEKPNIDGLVDFLCREKGFSEDRVRKGAEKLERALGKKQQGRLDGFFTCVMRANAGSALPSGRGTLLKISLRAQRLRVNSLACLFACSCAWPHNYRCTRTCRLICCTAALLRTTYELLGRPVRHVHRRGRGCGRGRAHGRTRRACGCRAALAQRELQCEPAVPRVRVVPVALTAALGLSAHARTLVRRHEQRVQRLTQPLAVRRRRVVYPARRLHPAHRPPPQRVGRDLAPPGD